MVSGIVGLPGSLLDDDSLGIAPAPSNLWIDIILSIVASRKASFSVLEVTASDVTRERYPTALFELFEQIVGFPWRCCARGRRFYLIRRADKGVGIQRSVGMVGSGDGDRRHQAEHAQQGDEKTDEPNPSPSKGGHSLFSLGKTVTRKATVAFTFEEGQTMYEPSPRYLDVSSPVC